MPQPPSLPLLRQPDQFSCGAAVVVVHRMLHDRAYAARVTEHFGTEVLTVHSRLLRLRGLAGRLQLPWPRLLGTPPWSVAQAMEAATGRRHRTHWILPWRRTKALSDMRAALATGPVALYVGNRWLPRHVLLVIDTGLHTYDPARGDVVPLKPDAFVTAQLAVRRWTHPWVWVSSTRRPSRRGCRL